MRKWLIVSVAIAILDIYTKYLIQKNFAYTEMLPINAYFDLVHYHNKGSAFGFLNDAGDWQRWFFSIISVFAVIMIIYLMKKNITQKIFCTGLSLVLGGALGNLYDRLTLGYVVDFLNFHYQHYYWPAFNVADSAIFLGVVFLLWDSFKAKNNS